jgi:hypothetical protein
MLTSTSWPRIEQQLPRIHAAIAQLTVGASRSQSRCSQEGFTACLKRSHCPLTRI